MPHAFNSAYIPNSPLKATFSAFKKSISYRVWKRKLSEFSNYISDSDFAYLDVGFGAGAFLDCIHNWYPCAKLYGVDIKFEHIEYVKEKIPSAALFQYDGCNLPFKDSSIDVLSIIQVVEHIADPTTFLKEARRVLSQNGILILRAHA